MGGISLETAQQLLLDLTALPAETVVNLWDASGRVLSQDLTAQVNNPSFERSQMDGYAMRSTDIAAASQEHPIHLQVIEEIGAGYMASQSLRPGTAIKVMTGAPIPAGADVVIKYEELNRIGDDIEVGHKLRTGSNIAPAGEDIKKGEFIASRGTRITPPILGMIASLGMTEVPVFSKIKVALLSTGSELIPPGEQMRPAKIYSSTIYTLHAKCQDRGIETVSLGIVNDDQAMIADLIQKGLQETNLIITTGGVAVGDYDLVKFAVDDVGAVKLFDKIDIGPGSSLVAARKDEKLIVGLSGNPKSAILIFDLLVVPVLRKMIGLNQHMPIKTEAVLVNDFNKPSSQRRFLYGRIYYKSGRKYIELTSGKSRGILKSMVGSNVVVDVPAGTGILAAGTVVNAYITGRIE